MTSQIRSGIAVRGLSRSQNYGNRWLVAIGKYRTDAKGDGNQTTLALAGVPQSQRLSACLPYSFT